MRKKTIGRMMVAPRPVSVMLVYCRAGDPNIFSEQCIYVLLVSTREFIQVSATLIEIVMEVGTVA